MIEGMALLLACQLAGEAIVRAFGLPMPGPVLGLALLLCWLAIAGWRQGTAAEQVMETPGGRVAQALLGALSILFVPAAVGVVEQIDLIGKYWLALGLAISVSTILAMIVAVHVFLAVNRMLGKDTSK